MRFDVIPKHVHYKNIQFGGGVYEFFPFFLKVNKGAREVECTKNVYWWSVQLFGHMYGKALFFSFLVHERKWGLQKGENAY